MCSSVFPCLLWHWPRPGNPWLGRTHMILNIIKHNNLYFFPFFLSVGLRCYVPNKIPHLSFLLVNLVTVSDSHPSFDEADYTLIQECESCFLQQDFSIAQLCMHLLCEREFNVKKLYRAAFSYNYKHFIHYRLHKTAFSHIVTVNCNLCPSVTVTHRLLLSLFYKLTILDLLFY